MEWGRSKSFNFNALQKKFFLLRHRKYSFLSGNVYTAVLAAGINSSTLISVSLSFVRIFFLIRWSFCLGRGCWVNKNHKPYNLLSERFFNALNCPCNIFIPDSVVFSGVLRFALALVRLYFTFPSFSSSFLTRREKYAKMYVMGLADWLGDHQ